jgi:hypothetical protein
MVDGLFTNLKLQDVHHDVMRNIVSIRQSQDLFDDLSPNSNDWVLAQRIEDDVKPYSYASKSPIIDRPFEEADWLSVIEWPFKHWQNSRFSNGSYGVWYGCDSVETSVYETAFHWFNGLLCDAGFENEQVVGERKVYKVACVAALLDLRLSAVKFQGLIHKTDYSYTQSVGARVHREGHPGLITQSARRDNGHNYVVFNAKVLSNPRHYCQLTYRLDGKRVVVEKTVGVEWMTVAAA